ncbi:hypothetical protein J2X65_003186 [Ancylobacter sp. 3268]|uniref:hypothetical protein n=1 Tax=Ancylobacter sp. 3268 TaxID=2817752 RepID=UPI002854AD72|nr:hypothetical protein [Ancylobacter sp. 3268]MDR6953823.1 hypothetical protein [Ancylobacter sp. 3268]
MANDRIGAHFKLKVRCFNCRVDTVHRLAVPAAEDAPECVDDLLESQFLRDQRFQCKACEAPIGVIVAAVEVKEPADA